MAKAIYCIIIFLFRDQFLLTPEEEEALLKISLFVALIYFKSWYSASETAAAPRNDLQLIKNIEEYRSYDEYASTVALVKFKRHLWYFSEINIAFSVFDAGVSDEVTIVPAYSHL